VKRFLQRALSWIERHLFAQVHAQLDAVEKRLETVSTRLDEVQAVVEETAARMSVSTEQTLGVVESDARTRRRFDEIERILGATPPGAR
jgi:hypothetical protein